MVWLAVIILGLAFGSFLNVCIYRLQRGKSLVKPGSTCPNCGYKIRFLENIPVLSYLFLRGKCSNCKKPISLRYPLVEILAALFSVLLFQQYGLSPGFIFTTTFVFLVIIIAFIDIDKQIIPNGLLIIGIIPALFPLVTNGLKGSLSHLLGGVGLGLCFFMIGSLGKIILRQESMGMGDVKYAALIGLFLGWKLGLLAAGLAFIIAALLIVILLPTGKMTMGERIPFGPFLSLGTVIAIIWGPSLIQGYLKLIVY
ncbi:MAG: prepilin peptidase [Candidatus Neomarinimicrobiota bacterium]